MSTVGSRIKKAREAAKLSQIDLGKACGLSRAAVSQWELGTTKSPTSENIFAIAAATGFSARWLSMGKGPEREGEAQGVQEKSPVYGLSPLHAALLEDIKDFSPSQVTALIKAAGYIGDGIPIKPDPTSSGGMDAKNEKTARK